MSKKVLIIIIVVGVIFLGGIGGAFYMLWSKLGHLQSDNGEAPSVSEPVEKEEKGPKAMGPTFALDTFIVNLADEGGQRYLRVTMELELKNKVDIEAARSRLPQIRDAILRILPEKSSNDIKTMAGKDLLREQIMKKINELLGESVVAIYFTEFVIQ